MNKRNIGNEILEGLQDIRAWKRGKKELKQSKWLCLAPKMFLLSGFV
jgi:hypothetical protein